jgi:hypothetical protein
MLPLGLFGAPDWGSSRGLVTERGDGHAGVFQFIDQVDIFLCDDISLLLYELGNEVTRCQQRATLCGLIYHPASYNYRYNINTHD